MNDDTYRQYITRDIIDMAFDYERDKNVLEFLSSFVFNLLQLNRESHDRDWDKIFNVIDAWCGDSVHEKQDYEDLRKIRQKSILAIERLKNKN